MPFGEEREAGPPDALSVLEAEGEPEPAPPDPSQARLLLTEPRPAGFGEVLVTEVWLPPEAADEDAEKEEEPPDRQRQWELRQELRELGLLRERPLTTHDARFETYWAQAKEALETAPNAIVDPYTHLAAGFADAHVDSIAEHRQAAREYGRQGDELLEVGRAYVAIGRQKSARSVLQTAARAEPQSPEAWYNLGVVRLFARANAEARAALEKALDQTPGDSRAELALAVACYHMRDYAGAEEHLRRLAGASGPRATARSMLACCHRMQEKWDDARVELAFLKDAGPGDWEAVTRQCLDCVERGEQRQQGPLRARRRGAKMWKALAAVAAGGIWMAYAWAKDLFKEQGQWAAIPLFVLVLLVARALRGISGRELPGEFGNAEQGLPCWQSTTWMRPRRSEF
jgi:tetratricopeptide (TPR) repeat protein